jgi:hypothetical protein
MTLSNYAENALGNHALRGGTAPMTAVAQAYLHLYATDPTEADTATELTTAGGYAPQAINFSAPTNGVFPNSGAVNFPTGATLSSAAFSGAAAFMGIRDSVTPNGGNLLWYGPCISSTPIDFVAKPSLFQSPAHGFVATDLVVFWGDNLPAGLTQGTRYFVIAGGLTADAFAVSTTSGGASITLTGNGSGRVAKDGTQTVTAANQQIIIPIGNVQASLQ